MSELSEARQEGVDIWTDAVTRAFSPEDFQTSLDNFNPMEDYPEKGYQDFGPVSAEPWPMQVTDDSSGIDDFMNMNNTHIDDVLRDVLESESRQAVQYDFEEKPSSTELTELQNAYTPAPNEGVISIRYGCNGMDTQPIEEQVVMRQNTEYSSVSLLNCDTQQTDNPLGMQLGVAPLPPQQMVRCDAVPTFLLPPSTPNTVDQQSILLPDTCPSNIPTVVAALTKPAQAVRPLTEAKADLKRKPSRRQRKLPPPKEKLYDRKEPYADPKLEKRRLDAIKSRDQRIRDKRHRQELEEQISNLKNELRGKDAIISSKDLIISQRDQLLNRYKNALKDMVAFHEGFKHTLERNDIGELLQM